MLFWPQPLERLSGRRGLMILSGSSISLLAMFYADDDRPPVVLDAIQIVPLSGISVSNGKSWNERRWIPGKLQWRRNNVHVQLLQAWAVPSILPGLLCASHPPIRILDTPTKCLGRYDILQRSCFSFQCRQLTVCITVVWGGESSKTDCRVTACQSSQTTPKSAHSSSHPSHSRSKDILLTELSQIHQDDFANTQKMFSILRSSFCGLQFGSGGKMKEQPEQKFLLDFCA